MVNHLFGLRDADEEKEREARLLKGRLVELERALEQAADKSSEQRRELTREHDRRVEELERELSRDKERVPGGDSTALQLQVRVVLSSLAMVCHIRTVVCDVQELRRERDEVERHLKEKVSRFESNEDKTKREISSLTRDLEDLRTSSKGIQRF